MERKDIIGVLFLLFSALVITDLLVINFQAFSIFLDNKAITSFFIGAFVIISILVMMSFNGAKRFIYLFWNTIFAAVIGAMAFKMLRLSPSIMLKVLYSILIIYSAIVVFSMGQIAKHSK